MIREVAAKRYAEAAYLLARESGAEDTWSASLAAMFILFADPEAQALLQSKRIPAEEKQKLVEDSLVGADPLVLSLAHLLLRRGRTDLGPQIAEAYQEMVDEAKGIAHALVTSAIPLSQEDVTTVVQRLSEITGREIAVGTEVDESILGGLVVRIGDRLIDGSTKSKLEALRHQLSGTRG